MVLILALGSGQFFRSAGWRRRSGCGDGCESRVDRVRHPGRVFYPHPGAAGAAPFALPPLATGFIAALVAALWAYDGWNNVGMVASEVKNPGAKSAFGPDCGTSAVIAIYMLANWAYFRV